MSAHAHNGTCSAFCLICHDIAASKPLLRTMKSHRALARRPFDWRAFSIVLGLGALVIVTASVTYLLTASYYLGYW